MARPVVVTAQAAEGIRAEAGRDFMLAQDEAGLASAVVVQLQARTRCSQARACILAHYDWTRNLSMLDALFEAAPSASPVLETCPA